jgi:hypothetical protein
MSIFVNLLWSRGIDSKPGGIDSLARVCKRLKSQGIDSEESIPPACVAWRAGTTNRVVEPARLAGNRFLGSRITNTGSGLHKRLQVRALYSFKALPLQTNRTRTGKEGRTLLNVLENRGR